MISSRSSSASTVDNVTSTQPYRPTYGATAKDSGRSAMSEACSSLLAFTEIVGDSGDPPANILPRTRNVGCTRITTPGGDVPVTLIRPGEVVWTTNANGHRVAAPVERVVRPATPGAHLMLRLALSDGRVLVAAGAHPAADGGYLRQLHPGQRYDGATVISVGWTTSTAPATFDLLPTGPTGTYWADGILVGSTLK